MDNLNIDLDYEDDESVGRIFLALCKNCARLRKFRFRSRCISEEFVNSLTLHLEFLARNPRLRELNINWKKDNAAADLKAILIACPKLRKIRLSIMLSNENHVVSTYTTLENVLKPFGHVHPKRRIRCEYKIIVRDEDHEVWEYGERIVQRPETQINNLTKTHVNGLDPEEQSSDDSSSDSLATSVNGDDDEDSDQDSGGSHVTNSDREEVNKNLDGHQVD